MNESEVITEVERYMGLPGQACAYKVGQLKILRVLRILRAAHCFSALAAQAARKATAFSAPVGSSSCLK